MNSSLVLPIAIAVAALGIIVILGARIRRGPGGVRRARATLRLSCTVCQQELEFSSDELVPITGPDIALLVREVPDIQGRALGEYQCPHCGTDHCFLTDVMPPRWVVANPIRPQDVESNFCTECRKPLVKPDWPEGAHRDTLESAPQVQPKHGLVCPRCAAVCCVECCTNATRNRTPDGSLLCPRCFRGPLTNIHRF